MSRKTTRNAQGSGTIRQRPDGRWEARYVAGIDTGTGKQIRRSIYGDSEKEVRKQLTAILHALDNGTYVLPQKMKLMEWLNIWLTEYAANSVKPNTLLAYKTQIENHIAPALGAVQLQALTAHSIQKMYNALSRGTGGDTRAFRKDRKNLSRCASQSVDTGRPAGLFASEPRPGM